jgi:hypothetical protein
VASFFHAAHRFAMDAAQERFGDRLPVGDEGPHRVRVEHEAQDVRGLARGLLPFEQEGKEVRRRAVGFHDVPARIHDDGRERLLLGQNGVERAANRLERGSVERGLRELGREAGRQQERVPLA